MRLGLGTAEFGMAYGLNKSGEKPSTKVITSILSRAYSAGVRLLDTASAYGDSEEALGRCVPLEQDFRIVTKTPGLHNVQGTPQKVARMISTFQESLRRLRRSRIYGLLFHRAADLLAEDGNSLWEAMQTLKEKKQVEKVGASIYTALEIEDILHRFPIDMIQVPINVLDQRLIQNGLLKKLKERKIEIHGRSIFLQGAMLMDPERLPKFLKSLKSSLLELHHLADQHGLTPQQVAVSFALTQTDLDYVLIGVNSLQELEEALQAVQKPPTVSIDWSRFAVQDPQLLNPSLWPTSLGRRP